MRTLLSNSCKKTFVIAILLILNVSCSSDTTDSDKKEHKESSSILPNTGNDFYKSMKKISDEQKEENGKISKQLMEGYDEVTEFDVEPYVPPLVKVVPKENKD